MPLGVVYVAYILAAVPFTEYVNLPLDCIGIGVPISCTSSNVNVIKSSVATLSRFRPVVIFETLPGHTDTTNKTWPKPSVFQQSFAILKELNYYLYKLNRGNLRLEKLNISSTPGWDTIAIHNSEVKKLT